MRRMQAMMQQHWKETVSILNVDDLPAVKFSPFCAIGIAVFVCEVYIFLLQALFQSVGKQGKYM